MATESPKHDSTHAELAALKQHTAILTQTVMALLQHLAQAGQRPAGPPGGAPQGQPNPALMQRIAQMAAARRAQQMGGAPGGMPPQGGAPQMGGGAPPMRPPGMAMGGLQMGMNRLEPMGNFSRGIAHAMTPTHMNFHAPRLHMAMGGLPMAHPMMHRPMPMGAGMPMQHPMMRPGMSSLGGAPMGGAPLV
jgi:hypothetical protein